MNLDNEFKGVFNLNNLVTAIIPTFKGARKLSCAIDSLINQTYEPIEIIVVDDNEPSSLARKQTEEILNNYKNSNIKYIKHDKNKNGAAARNTGILNASGEYICFLDDDDFYLSDRVEKSLNELINNRTCDAIYCGVIIINNEKICEVISAEKILTQKDILLNQMAIGSGSNIFISRSVINKLGGFDESFRRHQDLEFMLRFLKYFRITNLNEILIVKGINGTDNTLHYKELKITKGLFFEKFEKEINGLSKEEKHQFYKNQYGMLLLLATKSKDKTYIKEAICNLKEYRELNIKEKIFVFMGITKIYDSIFYKKSYDIYQLLKQSNMKLNKCSLDKKTQQKILKMIR